MIPKENRFHGHNSLNAVYKHGQAVSVSQVSLKHLAANGGKKLRLSVVVSRKVSKSAVIRNRIRRRVYENMHLKMSAITEPRDIVINVYNEQLATMKADELNNILSELLVRSGLSSVANDPGRDIVNGKGN